MGISLAVALGITQPDDPELTAEPGPSWRLRQWMLADAVCGQQRSFLPEEVAERLTGVELPGVEELISGGVVREARIGLGEIK